MTNEPKPPEHEYDVALSVAGADRHHARKLARLLESRGRRVFYYEHEQQIIWGKRAREWAPVFGTGTRFFVPFVSRHYEDQDWCAHEFSVARDEAERRETEFILPVRLDDTKLVGLPYDLGYVDLRQENIEHVADLICAKLDQPVSEWRATASRSDGQDLPLLNALETRALALLSLSVLPLRVSSLRRLFPGLEWKKLIEQLAAKGLAHVDNGRIQVPEEATEALFPSRESERPYHEAWLRVLLPKGNHVDLELAVFFHRLALEDYETAVQGLSEVAQAVEDFGWSTICRETLERVLRSNRLRHRLSNECRVELHNSIGLCLLREGKPEEAKQRFDGLLRYSRRVGHARGRALGYMNRGICWQVLGRPALAKQSYHRAIRLSDTAGDRVVQAKALANLSSVQAAASYEDAVQTMERSIAVRKQVGDTGLVVWGYLQKGMIAALYGGETDARACFVGAVEIARGEKELLSRLAALSACAEVQTEYGCAEEAAELYREMAEAALGADLLDWRAHALERRAHAAWICERYSDAATALAQLTETRESMQEHRAAAEAMLSQSTALLLAGDREDAEGALRRSIRYARKHDDSDLMAKAKLARAQQFEWQDKLSLALTRIKEGADIAEEAGHLELAAHLWERSAEQQMKLDAPMVDVRESLENALRLLDQVEEADAEWERLAGNLFAVLWNHGTTCEALAVLRRFEERCRERGREEKLAAVLDQRGTCHQELGDLVEGVRCHQEAAAIYERIGSQLERASVLLNLGECYRRQGKWAESRELFEDVAAVAERADPDLAIMALTNKAVTLRALGEEDKAIELLKRCRNRARRADNWQRYCRAVIVLAELALDRSDFSLARQRLVAVIGKAQELPEQDRDARILLSYVLRALEQEQEACDVLEGILPPESDPMAGYRTLIARADARRACGDVEGALALLTAAKTHADEVGLREGALECSLRLARLLAEDGQAGLAQDEIADAMQNRSFDVESRGTILSASVDVCLLNGDKEGAQDAFDTAMALMERKGLDEQGAELCMRAAEHNWSSGGEAREGALALYVRALLFAEKDFQLTAEVFDRMFWLLLDSALEEGIESARAAEQSMRTWAEDNEIDGEATETVLLAPFRAAIGLAEEEDGGAKLTHDRVSTVLEQAYLPR